MRDVPTPLPYYGWNISVALVGHIVLVLPFSLVVALEEHLPDSPNDTFAGADFCPVSVDRGVRDWRRMLRFR